MRNETFALVQVRDAEGFWGNAAQFPSSQIPHAKRYAAFVAAENRLPARVALGSERKVIATFAPPTDEPDGLTELSR